MRFTWLNDFLDLIFPRCCEVCGTALHDQEICFCLVCEGQLPKASFHLRAMDNELTVKLQGLMPVNRVISFLRFTKKGVSQKLLHKLKYQHKPEIAEHLGTLYGLELSKMNYVSEWDVIVPVPLHPLKLKRRGYNQSEKFALGLSNSLQIKVQDLLIRKVFTETQTKKSRLQRLENVEEVFDLKINQNLNGANILLVDDVITTGATLIACAQVLLANGAKHVDLATIAAGGK